MTLAPIPDISPATSRPVPPPVDRLPIYSENGKGFLVGIEAGEYIAMSSTDLRRHLIAIGYNPKAAGAPLSEVEAAVHRIQTTKSVAYAGPLAGKSAGIHVVAGKRILVIGAPKIIQPDATIEWPTLRAIIEEMLGRECPEQIVHFYGWLKHAYVSLKDGYTTQGQVLALAGPRDCGKSLLQQVIREVLGGREANPYAVMMGRTEFNRELFGAEVLMFGDEVASTDYRNRVKFGANLKQFVVNSTQRCHGKGREAVTLDPQWRVTMSLNDEPASLEVLPPMSQDSLADKITLLKVRRPKIYDEEPWRTNSRALNWARLMAELPGFLAFLTTFGIPVELRDSRLGVRAYQNPDLLVTIGAESPERRLLELIDAAGLSHAPESSRVGPPKPERTANRAPWEGTAAEMEKSLFNAESVREQARRLLYYSSACGQFMAALAKTCPERVTALGLNQGLNRYRITPPEHRNHD